jgi:hypothetical protein
MQTAQTDLSLAQHRVILCHFDGYSAALFFARWPEKCLLWPGPLPEGASPAKLGVLQDGEAVRQTVIEQLGLNGEELVLMPEFDECLNTSSGPVRVHLLRFTGFEPPAKVIEPAGGSFKQLAELRGSAPAELALLREVFNLLVGGGMSGRK